jgi:hypothetical protein
MEKNTTAIKAAEPEPTTPPKQSWFDWLKNKIPSFTPKTAEKQTGGKSFKKTRRNRKRGGYVIKKSNSKSSSRKGK